MNQVKNISLTNDITTHKQHQKHIDLYAQSCFSPFPNYCHFFKKSLSKNNGFYTSYL